MIKPRVAVSSVLLSSLVLVGLARPAAATEIWFEAESATNNVTGQAAPISPFDVKDSNLASGDRYLEVESGYESKDSAPVLGRACYGFTAEAAGSFRVWARVLVPNDASDSFWLNMDNGSWIRWNQIALGSSWHWDHVHDNATPTVPWQFSLGAGDHTFCVAYREAGTKVDAFIVTDNASFSPTAALSGPPAAPPSIAVVEGDGRNVVSWGNALGATSYRLEKMTNFDPPAWATVASGLTVHSYFHDTTAGNNVCYRVLALASTGTSAPTDTQCGFAEFSPHANISAPSDWSKTAPLQYLPDDGDGLGAPEGNDSKDVVPVMGHARYDFRIAKTVTVGVWEIAVTPDSGSDSYWVRMDEGPWIKWNEITPTGNCGWARVHDSDNNNTPVPFTLGPGSHRLEFAYREDQTILRRSYIFPTSPGGCFD
jgi:hypothetical protein